MPMITAMKHGASWSVADANRAAAFCRRPLQLHREIKNMGKNTTGPKAATAAAKVLNSSSTGRASKTAAGSALTQAHSPRESTSSGAATAASKVLRDGRTSAASKSAAGSALSQRRK